ncbi:tetratricopeptide repeat protein, partial [Actinomyces naeslundii]|uniref:tetratricopeptide repeat protein n=1 Tax=Actinomyces naeslundii TaxID=1655 RepID=UPI00352E9AA0
LVEVTQAVHAQVVDSQSPDLAAGFTKLFNAVCSHIGPHKAHEAEQTLSEAGYFTVFLECELAQRATNIGRPTDDTPETDRATYASRKLSLSRCLANTGRHDEALKAAREATNLFRVLEGQNPAAYTPDLAMSLNNLANHLDSNGQQREALKTAQEAVTIRRNLAEHNPAAYTPDLATSLNNLAIYLDSNGQQREALTTAQEATNLYQELVSEHFRTFSSRFVTALATYASILDQSGNSEKAVRIRQERDEVLKRMKEMEEDDA